MIDSTVDTTVATCSIGRCSWSDVFTAVDHLDEARAAVETHRIRVHPDRSASRPKEVITVPVELTEHERNLQAGRRSYELARKAGLGIPERARARALTITRRQIAARNAAKALAVAAQLIERGTR